MLLTPRYGDVPVMSVEVRADGPHPMVGQRRRLEAVLRSLTEDQWHHPSRCAGWTVQDVITHLTSTNAFWALSIQRGLAGEATCFLAAFDPAASPAALVAEHQGTPTDVTLERFATSTEALARVVEDLDDEGWAKTAEAPPGHLPIRLVADHAVWDAWVHERDIVLPLGREPVVDDVEVRTCLRYGAALGRALALCIGASEPGIVEIQVTGPADRFVVDVGEDQVRIHAGPVPAGGRTIRADAVDLLEVLSRRDVGWPAPPEAAWLTAGLAEAFDQGGAD